MGAQRDAGHPRDGDGSRLRAAAQPSGVSVPRHKVGPAPAAPPSPGATQGEVGLGSAAWSGADVSAGDGNNVDTTSADIAIGSGKQSRMGGADSAAATCDGSSCDGERGGNGAERVCSTGRGGGDGSGNDSFGLGKDGEDRCSELAAAGSLLRRQAGKPRVETRADDLPSLPVQKGRGGGKNCGGGRSGAARSAFACGSGRSGRGRRRGCRGGRAVLRDEDNRPRRLVQGVLAFEKAEGTTMGKGGRDVHRPPAAKAANHRKRGGEGAARDRAPAQPQSRQRPSGGGLRKPIAVSQARRPQRPRPVNVAPGGASTAGGKPGIGRADVTAASVHRTQGRADRTKAANRRSLRSRSVRGESGRVRAGDTLRMWIQLIEL